MSTDTPIIRDLVLELFSEEIPARMQKGAARDLERMATERLAAAGLTWRRLQTMAGPRRLGLIVEDLPAATPDRSEEIKGPKISAPDQALEGFLRKTGLTRDQLTERDGVFYAMIDQKGVETAAVIADMVEQIVRGFPWPKSMRWGSGTLRWVRPLKRIACVLGGRIVPFEIDGIVSGDLTEGHRFMGSGRPVRITDPDSWIGGLADEYVLVYAGARAQRLEQDALAICEAAGLALVEDPGLLEEVAGLAEWPTPILGDMDPQFLDLPPEVVQLSMKTHQKYFAVRDPKTGKLAPHFVVVANVEASDGGAALAAGNSRVLSARLNDARFFWDEDLKTGFDVWNDKLKGVTFHAKLGTLAERVDRIAALAREIAPLVGADPDQAEQAARLAKADLASAMVGEFPELQGVMGGYYARAQYGDALSNAVSDHYKPQGPTDTVPTAPLTVALALADKLDTLIGFFAINEKPTGSKDPFAVRRAALGAIRLILENDIRFGDFEIQLQDWLAAHYAEARVLPGFSVKDASDFSKLNARPEVAGMPWVGAKYGSDEAVYAVTAHTSPKELLGFLADRLKVLLRDQGQRHDLVDAVFALGDDDLVRIVRRVEALAAFLATDDGANLLTGYKRASNILRAEEKKGPLPTGMIQTGLPGQPAEETELAFAVASTETAVDKALAAEDFAAAMSALARLRAPVDAFFDKVMVNSEVAAERDNRLKLLGQVRAVMGRVADFGQIAG